MTRKLLPLVFVLGLVAAACAEPPNPEIDLGSGTRFVPLVADSLNNAGVDPSIGLDPDGQPVVAYFAFPEETSHGTIPATRPVGAPTIPGVLMATASAEGLWTRGAMALEKQIPNVEVPFGPAFEPSVADLTAESVTGLRMVAAGEDFHAVWGSVGGLFYATGSLDPVAGTQVEVSQVTSALAAGPSVAVDEGGTPWIAFYSSTSEPASVELATPTGERWQTETIAEVGGCDTCRTAIVSTGDGPAVAYSDAGAGVSVATDDGDNGWVSSAIEDGASGRGLAATTSGGELALSYYSGGEVHVASGPASGPFEVSTVAPVADGSDTAEGSDTSIAADGAGTMFAAWHDAADGVGFASGDGATFTPIDTGGNATGGTMPSVAVTSDGAIAYVSWYDTRTQDLLVGAYGDLTGLAIAGRPADGGTPGPTGATEPPPPTPTADCTPVIDGKVTVVAEGVQFTDGRCIQAPAGEPFAIVFDNRDSGIQHNVQVFTGSEPSGDLLEGSWDIITGPDTIEYQVSALDAGEYAYNCVVHPNMIGSIQVVEGGAAGEASEDAEGPATGAITVTALSLAFDTNQISLAAGQENVVTLVNEDIGVPHNISIFTDDSLSTELFGGELITGPSTIDYAIPPLEPGEYYFLCIVHPNMNGTVIVQ